MVGHDWKRPSFISIFRKRRQFSALHAHVVRVIDGNTLGEALKRCQIRDGTDLAVFYSRIVHDKPITERPRPDLHKRATSQTKGECGNICHIVPTILPICSRTPAHHHHGGNDHQDSPHRDAPFVPSTFLMAGFCTFRTVLGAIDAFHPSGGSFGRWAFISP